jgi:hypothetical protein
MLKDQVDIEIVVGTDDLLQLYDIRMLEFHQEHYFSVGSLRVGRVVKCIEVFLECLYLFILRVNYLPYYPIGPTADLFDYFELA